MELILVDMSLKRVVLKTKLGTSGVVAEMLVG